MQKYDEIIEEQEKTGIINVNKKEPFLNEMLGTGPGILQKIFEILVKARCHKFLLVSDIHSAFLSI